MDHFSFVLIRVDLLTQVAEVSHHRANKLHPCRSSSRSGEAGVSRSAEASVSRTLSYVALMLHLPMGLFGFWGSGSFLSVVWTKPGPDTVSGSSLAFFWNGDIIRRAKSSLSEKVEGRWAEPTAQVCQHLKACSHLRWVSDVFRRGLSRTLGRTCVRLLLLQFVQGDATVQVFLGTDEGPGSASDLCPLVLISDHHPLQVFLPCPPAESRSSPPPGPSPGLLLSSRPSAPRLVLSPLDLKQTVWSSSLVLGSSFLVEFVPSFSAAPFSTSSSLSASSRVSVSSSSRLCPSSPITSIPSMSLSADLQPHVERFPVFTNQFDLRTIRNSLELVT